MKRLINYLGGTVRLSVSGPYPERVINLCAQNRVDFWAVDWHDEHTVLFTVRHSGLKQVQMYAQRVNAHVDEGERKGLPELLQKLKEQGKIIVLATSKPEEYAVKILKHFDLYQYFDFVAGATMDGSRGEKADVIIEENGWLKIKYNDGEAYIKAEYASVEFEVGEAQTMEQIRAAEAAAEAARKKAELKKKYEAVRASGNEVQVLGALIQLEAGGESYEGQLAVGAVVMNRVRSSRYPNTIADVIFAPGQFPAASSRVHDIMTRGVKASCLQAAQEAINGVSNIGSFTHFKSARSGVSGAHIVIGNHVFY